jgi:hypothetical protein
VNQETLLIAMIETPDAVENSDAIAVVEGVDTVHSGPPACRRIPDLAAAAWRALSDLRVGHRIRNQRGSGGCATRKLRLS